ncbi:hypothetical protein COK90_08885 [Priestia megaterium]|uniref:hypothetical protein n=1 Tax=Priestia megaterium TaxID=1404 RepID=UPI000BFA107D|nr:hypothetical protein [Priestia megaterium]PFU64059.1 hypothetical protein COK90_08885 [Priestia megaterium]
MKTIKIDIALIIVCLTGLAYGATYTYQHTFQAYYELPTMFIDLNINTLTSSVFLVIMLITVSCLLMHFTIRKISAQEIHVGFLVSLGLIVIVLAMYCGYASAATKKEYMIVKQEKELYVVVTPYKDNLVIAPLDIKNNTIKPKFQTIEMKDAKDTEIIKFEHGITVKKLKNSNELKKEIVQKATQ